MTHNPFNILTPKAEEYHEADANQDITKRIVSIISSSDIVLFMKGNAQYPQCGFSANTVKILNAFNCSFKTFDILSSPEIRQGVKEYSNWPTFPQLFVKGELIGGNDIVTEMYESGELEKVLNP